MKKLITLLIALILAFPAYAEENENNHTRLIRAACNNVMYKLQLQYGRRFFCHTDNFTAGNMNAAYLSDSIYGKSGIMLMRFGDVYYDNPSQPIPDNLHYSYNIQDMDTAIALIVNGGGLSEQQMNYQVCKKGIADTKEKIKKNNKDYLDKKIDHKTYEVMNSVFNDVIKNFEKCVSDNK